MGVNNVVKTLYNLLISFVALFVVDKLFDSITIDQWSTTLVAAVVLAVVNTFVKPIVSILSLPITLVTIGLFSLIINGAMLYLVAFIVDGFEISSFGIAVLASVVISILSGIFALKKD